MATLSKKREKNKTKIRKIIKIKEKYVNIIPRNVDKSHQ
jgi:hypothetical protein